MKPKKVYISTPLKPEKFDLNLIQKMILKENVFAFIPTTAESKDNQRTATLNRTMIDLCDEVWVFGPFGRDCSWECGYGVGIGKKVKFFADKTNEHMIPTDWMLFCKNTEIVRV